MAVRVGRKGAIGANLSSKSRVVMRNNAESAIKSKKFMSNLSS